MSTWVVVVITFIVSVITMRYSSFLLCAHNIKWDKLAILLSVLELVFRDFLEILWCPPFVLCAMIVVNKSTKNKCDINITKLIAGLSLC